MRSVVIVCLLASSAGAETSVEAAARGQALLTANDEVILGVSAGIARRWQDRWQLALRGGLALGDALEHQYVDVVAEGSAWFHPSSAVSVAFGWRAGYSYIHLKYGAHVHARMLENVFVLEVHRRIRVEPIVFTMYHSGPWQVALGARVGYCWQL